MNKTNKERSERENSEWLWETTQNGTLRKGVSDKTFKDLFFAIFPALNTMPGTQSMFRKHLLNERVDDSR